MNEKLTTLYINAKKHFDLPDFDQFKVDMQDPVKMSALRENMLKHYEMPSLDQMYQDFGVKKKDLPGVSTFQKEGMDSDIKEDPTTILSEYSGETLDLDKFLDKTEEEAITILQQELAGKNYLVEETGIGDALKVIDNDTGEETTIDLQPIKAFGIGSDKETEIKKINKLISKPTNLDFTEDSEAFKKIEEDIAKIKEEIDISIDTSEDEFLSDQDYFKNLFDILEKEGIIVPQEAKQELSSGKKITGYTTDFRGKLPVYGNLNKQDVLNGIQKYFGDSPKALEKIKQFNLGGATFFRQSQIDKATKLKIENYYESRPDRDKIKDIVFQVDKSMNAREVDIITNLELAKKDLSKLLASVKSDFSKIKEKSPGFRIDWNEETNSLDISGENIPEEANVLYKKISDAIDGNMQLIKKSTSDLEIINSKRKTSSEFTDAAKRNYNIIDSAYSDLKNAVVQMGGGFAMFPSLITDAIKDAVLPEGVYVPSVGFMNISTQQLRKEMGDSQENLQNFFKTKRAYKEAVDEDSFGEFAIREFFTQAPNLTLAIGTAGVGSSIGLSGAATSTLIASQFGVTSAGQKYDELTKRQEFTKIAKQGLSELEKLKGSIPDEQYLAEKYELERAIKDGDISAGKKTLAVLGTGLVEGTITRFLGTAPNAIKVVKDLKNPTKFMDDILKSNRKAVFEAGKDWTGRILGEIAEETSIDALTQINDFAFLGDQIDLSSLDDTAVTSIITSGAMNTPSIAYSTILTQVNVNRYKNQVKAQTDQIQALKKMLNDSGLTDFQRDAIHNTINTSISNIADITTNMEADALLLGADNIKELITLSGVKKSMMDKAGVEVNDSYEVAGAKIDNYIKLLKSTDKKQAKEFTDNMSYIDNRRNDIIKKINYEGAVEKVFGKKGLDVAATLPKGLSAQQVYTQTYDQIRNEINDNAKKEYEDTVEQVKPEVTEQVSPEQEVETVQELLNRPVTLTELGGSKLETPIEGSMYLDGQQVVVEDADGNITEIGNVDEISDKTLEDMGIKQQMPEVTATEDGNIEYQGKQYNPASANISLDSRGNVTKVVISEIGKARSKTFRGKNADDVVYNKFLIDATNLTDIEQKLEKDEEFQNELRKVKTTPKVKADEDTQESVEQTGVERLKGLFDRKQVGTERRNSLDQKIKIDEQVEKAKKSLGKLFPDITIDAYYNENEYYRARGKRDNSRGVFNSATNTISINLTNADKATVPHEVFHALLFNTLKSDPKIQKVVKDMVKAMKNTQDPGLIKFLSDEIQRLGYEENVQNEEIMSELFGALAGDYKNLKPNTQNIIKKFLDKLAKLLGLKPFTDTEIIGVLNTLAGRVAKGEAITEQDVELFKGGKVVDNPISALNKRSVGAFDVQYTEENKKQELIGRGLLAMPETVEDFSGQEAAITSPDDMLAGTISIDGKQIFEGGGGVFFVTKYGDVWASGKEGTANTLKNNINKSLKKNQGKGYLVLAKGSEQKLISSVSGVNSSLAILDVMLDKNLISLSDFRNSVSSSVKAAGGIIKLGGSAKQLKSDINKYFSDTTTTTFETRGNVVKDIIGRLAQTSSVKENSKKIIELLGGDLNKGLAKGSTPKSQSLGDLVAGVAAEKLTKGLSTGDIYAIIEVNDEVEVVKDSHPSYPYHVKIKNNKKPVLHLLKTRDNGSKVFTLKSGKSFKVGNVSVMSGSFNEGYIREQKGQRPSIEEVYKKAEENNISKKEARDFLREIGYSQKEISEFVFKKEQIYVKGNNFVLDALDNMKRYLFSAKSFMPKNAFIAKETMNGMVQSEIKAAERNAKKLNNLMKNKSDEMHNKVEAFLRGEKVELPLNIAMLVKEMRTHIDSLSRQLIDSGAIKTSESKENIFTNIGSYLNRSYRLFNDKNYVDNLSEEVINEAKEFLKKQIEKNLKSEAQNKEISLETLVKSKEDVTTETVSEYIEKSAQQQVNDIIKKSEANSFVISATEGVKKDVTILKERKDIPSEIRALMGEYTDPAFNYVMSVAKIKSLVETQKYLEKLRDIGEGVFLFKENDIRRPSNYKKISAAKEGKAVYSPAFSPLDGLYGPPEMIDQMKKKTGGLNFDSPIANAIYKGWIKGVGAVKFSKTILSLGTHAKNVLGNLYFMAQNGYINPKDYNNAFKVLKNSTNEELSKKLEEYIKLGFLNQNVSLNEVKSLLEGDESFDVRISKRMLDKGESRAKKIAKDISKKTNKFFQVSQDLYQAEDDLFKIVAYENEKMDYAKILFNKDLDKLNEREKKAVDDKVSEIVKNILPNYSRVGGLGKGLRAFPVAGTFISFQLEAYRTAWNTIHLAKTEMKSNSPKEREKGVKRLFAIIATQGIKYGMMALATSGLLDDEEEEKVGVMDVRPMLPRWAKNADIIVTQAGDGKFRYINVSASDPFGGIARAFNTLMREEDPINGLIEMTREIADPVINPDILTGALAQLTQNRNQYGNPIWGSTDSVEEKLLKAVIHIGKVFEPGTITSGRKIYNADEKVYETIGQFTGYKPHEVDVNKQLHFRLQDIKVDADEVNKILTKEKYNVRDTGDASGIYNALEQVDEKMAPIYKNANELVNSAIKVGVPIYEINRNIKSKKFKKKDRLNILFYDRLGN